MTTTILYVDDATQHAKTMLIVDALRMADDPDNPFNLDKLRESAAKLRELEARHDAKPTG